MMRLTVGTKETVSWEQEYWRVCGVVGVSKADWGCGGWIVEVYKWFAEGVCWGHYRFVTFRLERLDNSCRGAQECVA